MTQARVAVVVVNYASADLLRQLLHSLQGEPIAATYVWDNFSTLAERRRLEQLQEQYPQGIFHYCDFNLGFGGAVNSAISLFDEDRNFDYYWILNPDVQVRPGSLDGLVDSARALHIDLLSPLILKGSTDLVWYAGGSILRLSGRSVHLRMGEDSRRLPPETLTCSFVTGAALLIDSRAWRRLGGFDERFFLYCEDADLSIRARRLGLVQAVDLRAVVEHSEGGSSGGEGAKSSTFYYYAQRNRILLYGGGWRTLGLLFGPGLPETLRLLVLTFRPLKGSGRRFASSLLGLAAGMRGEQGERDGVRLFSSRLLGVGPTDELPEQPRLPW